MFEFIFPFNPVRDKKPYQFTESTKNNIEDKWNAVRPPRNTSLRRRKNEGPYYSANWYCEKHVFSVYERS